MRDNTSAKTFRHVLFFQKAKVSATEEWCEYLRVPAICKSSGLHLHTNPSRIKNQNFQAAYMQGISQKNVNLGSFHLSHTGEQALQGHNKERATLDLGWE